MIVPEVRLDGKRKFITITFSLGPAIEPSLFLRRSLANRIMTNINQRKTIGHPFRIIEMKESDCRTLLNLTP